MRLTLARPEVLSSEEIGLIHRGALRILAEMGMEIQNEKLLALLQEQGLRIDLQSQRVKFPKEVVERFIAEAEKTDWTSAKPKVAAEAGIYLSQFHDPETLKLVPWTEERLAYYSALARSLPNVGGRACWGAECQSRRSWNRCMNDITTGSMEMRRRIDPPG